MLECCSHIECAFCSHIIEPNDFYQHLITRHPKKLNDGEQKKWNQSSQGGIFNFSQQKSLSRLRASNSKQRSIQHNFALAKSELNKSAQF
jgi:hypothetical protein